LESLIYIGTALITVLWSVWIYSLFGKRVGLSEDSGFRYVLIILPSSLFLLILFSNWQSSLFIRLDLIGLVLLDVVTVIAAVILLFVLNIKGIDDRKGYIFTLLLYFLASLLLVVMVFAVKIFPPLLIRVYQVIEESKKFNFGNFTWSWLNPEKHENSVASLMNKLLLALLTYIPLSLVRFFYNRRQMKKLIKRIDRLEYTLKNHKNNKP